MAAFTLPENQHEARSMVWLTLAAVRKQLNKDSKLKATRFSGL
jgi:hypothetical protein